MDSSSETIPVGARLEIDLGALARNWQTLAAMAPAAETAAVVKADAYGLGAAEAVPALVAAGCRTFFVATLAEALAIRAVDDAATIFVLNGLPPGGANRFAQYALRPILNSLQEIEEWIASGHSSVSPGIQIDTGMNRLGLPFEEAKVLSSDKAIVDRLRPSLIMSHLACADTPDHPKNAEQLRRFEEIKSQFPEIPGSLCNSAGIMLGSDYQFDLTRPGIALYGGRASSAREALEPVVTAKTQILQVRDAEPGETVGYGARESLNRPARLAALSVGYADGYLRAAGSSDDRPGARVFICGKPAPLVGRVSMDLMVADVTDIPEASRGDWAELFGPNIMIDDVAERAGTIGYELLTALGSRYARSYRRQQPS